VNVLKRELAPITPEAWQIIDSEATRVLGLHLGARKVVDLEGPKGLRKGSVSTGRSIRIEAPRSGVDACLRVVQPLVELRVPFRLSITELDDVSRGATDPDLAPLVSAAERVAAVEDTAIFQGYAAANIEGITPTSSHEPVVFAESARLPAAVVAAKEKLRRAGVSGPYALVLGPSIYDEVFAEAEGGFPIRDRVQSLVEKIVWAPSLTEGLLVSIRGGDFELTVGQDLALGYTSHDAEGVDLYLSETMTFRVLEPAAAIAVRRGPSSDGRK
jgi:uncharacterized linocin/CFP29 family protein